MAIAKVRNSKPFVNTGATNGPANKVDDKHYNRGEYDSVVAPAERFLGDAWESDGPFLPVSATGDNGLDLNITFPPAEGCAHVIHGVDWSHASGVIHDATITIESPSGTKIFGPHYIESDGPGFHNFAEGLKGARGSELAVVLAGAESGIARTLTVRGHHFG